PLFEGFHDPERMQIVIEPIAERTHLRIERLLPGMGKRRMPDIVRESERFRQILIELKYIRQGTCDLRDLDGMGQAVAEVVGETWCEDLGLGFKAAKRSRVDHAVAVALECVAIRMDGFGIGPAPASGHRKSQQRQHRDAATYCCGSSPNIVSAIWLTWPTWVRSGSSNLRASAGFFGARKRASEMAACSLDTKIVGCSIRSRRTFSP